MPEDPTPLAQRLTDAARPHVWGVQDAETPEDVEALVRGAVVAVLRELDAAGTPSEPGGMGGFLIVAGVRAFGQVFSLGPFERDGLRALADSIEKGEG